MLGGESITNKFEKYGDGIITSRKTFQKYYSQNEFREYLRDVLGETAISIGHETTKNEYAKNFQRVFSDSITIPQFAYRLPKIDHTCYCYSCATPPQNGVSITLLYL